MNFGGNTTKYTYDVQNQLVRENNQTGGYTYFWTYDNASNILSHKEYAYATGPLGTSIDTVNYTYGNANWGDLLAKYDNQTITHNTGYHRISTKPKIHHRTCTHRVHQ